MQNSDASDRGVGTMLVLTNAKSTRKNTLAADTLPRFCASTFATSTHLLFNFSRSMHRKPNISFTSFHQAFSVVSNTKSYRAGSARDTYLCNPPIFKPRSNTTKTRSSAHSPVNEPLTKSRHFLPCACWRPTHQSPSTHPGILVYSSCRASPPWQSTPCKPSDLLYDSVHLGGEILDASAVAVDGAGRLTMLE